MSNIDIEQVASEAFGAGWTCVEIEMGARKFVRDAAEVIVWHGAKGRVSSVDLNRDSNGDRMMRSYYPPDVTDFQVGDRVSVEGAGQGRAHGWTTTRGG